MIHGSGSGLLDPVLRRYTFLEGKADLLISMPKWHLAGEGQSAYFGAKMAPCCGGWIRVLGTQLLDPAV
jgi:hypothetical protein